MTFNHTMAGWVRRAATTALLGTLMSAAQALPALWVYGAYGYNNPYHHTGSTTFAPGNLIQVDDNAAFAAMASMNGPIAQAYVDTAGYMLTNLPNAGVEASAAVQYDFYVSNGQTFSDLVPITIKGRAFMTTGGNAEASGYARLTHSTTEGGVNNRSFDAQYLGWGCGSGGSDCSLVDFEWHVNISAFAAAQPGEIARVSLFAKAKIPNAAAYATQASAWVDPLISIDESYLATHPGARLVMDASITNMLAPVPEPTTWGLMLAGLAAVGLRRKRI